MPKKKKRRYGDYTQIMKGDLYAVVNLRQPDGKYKKKYKKVDSRTEAFQWAVAELDKHKNAEKYNDALTFREFGEWYKTEFLHDPVFEKGRKVSGVKDFERLKNKVDTFRDFYGDRLMKDFSDYDIHRWVKHRRDGGIMTATINRDLSLMRTMFKKGFRFKKVLSVPVFEINSAGEIERDRVMTFAEEKLLLSHCVDKEILKKKSKRQKPYETEIRANRAHLKTLIIIAVDTSMRKGEMLSLEWRDIDFDAELITLRPEVTKGQFGRVNGMTPRVKAELLAIYEKSDKKPSSKVFPFMSFKSAFETACLRAKIDDLHFHDLRHTAITRMIRAGVPHAEVMKISGHRTLKTFLRYLNIQPEAIQSASQKLAEFMNNQEK